MKIPQSKEFRPTQRFINDILLNGAVQQHFAASLRVI